MKKQHQKPSSQGKAIASSTLKSLIRIYQLLCAPLLGHNCRYMPSCSAYGIDAIEAHGPILGSWLTIKRICRCRPWGGNGFDPVPPAPVSTEFWKSALSQKPVQKHKRS